jgi:hypothetical protein
MHLSANDLFFEFVEPESGEPAPRVDFFGQVGAIRKIKGVLVHPIAIADFLARFPDAGRFQVVIGRAAGESFERATLRVGLRDAGLVGSPAARDLEGRIAAAVKGALLISMDVATCAEADIPERAAGPSFAEAIVSDGQSARSA